MTDELFHELQDPRVMAALTLGTRRAAMEPPASLGGDDAERWPLLAAAILGQENSFRRPSAPKFQAGACLPESDGPWLTESERSMLLRLVAAEKDYDGILAALWAGLRASTRSLHPFDLPALRPLLMDPAAVLGPVESAWLTMNAWAGKSAVATGGSWTDETWLEATPAVQGDYVLARRRQDPAAGRALVEIGLQGQPAATRCRLVEALACGLSEADQELLESLLSDRAKSVKELSADLLSRIPGTDAYAARVEEALAQFEVGKKGLLARKRTLKLRRSAIPRRQVLLRARAIFQPIRTEDLAQALELSIEEMYGAASKDALLQSLFLGRAMMEGEEATLRAAACLPEADGWGVLTGGVTDFDSVHLAKTLPLVLRPKQWAGWPTPYELDQLQAILAGPLPEDVARELLDGEPLKETLKKATAAESPDGSRFLRLVGLVPPSLHPLLKERLSALPFYCTSVALELIQFTAALLAPNPTDD